MPKAKTQYTEIDDIREDLDSLKNNVIELTRTMKKNGTVQTAAIRDVAIDRIEDLKTSGKAQINHLERRVKAKPAESVAIAFATGLAVSLLLGRR
ncbi:MAG: hypothetical protein CBB87_04865 [Micavibrio sp. TMED27]|nr:hypothetical protein [Micavibrio sp.]OUT91364.1 MAG: hypothetical protein CBB87_04865 [Micavibrio sp. TMED27]|tara:strand:+ start:3468 stop:3752 length:285 start_codon:yes stop_codon:yes gene_type:complete